MSKSKAALLVDQYGTPVTAAKVAARDRRCPQCLGTKRVKSCGFGHPATLCGICGHDFLEPWQEGQAE